MERHLFLGTQLWAVEPAPVNCTARKCGLYGTHLRAEVLLPAKIHHPAFIRKFSKHYFYKIKACDIANKDGKICSGGVLVVPLSDRSEAFLIGRKNNKKR
ncbi:hypothetical protein [Bacteroides congonensis]|uniref:hypothetical protein n=1 Tax=Bacteroides congonensis TaxID=1871006 RepID=UPI0025ABA1C1|nr:hypothetical protein [Bacteroides congonensis]